MLPNRIRRGAQHIRDRVRDTITDTTQQISELDTKGKIFLVIGFICIFIFLNFLYKKIFKKKKEKFSYTVKYFDEGKNCLNNPVIYNNPRLNNTGEGGQYTYSVWLRINNWYSNYNKWKTIFRKGSETDINLTDWCSYSEQSPGLYLGNKINNLRVVLTTTNSNGLQLEKCDINNVPIKNWFLLTIVVNNNNLSIYINAKLERTCVFSGIIKNNNGPININSPLGFDGLLANLEYFNISLDQTEILQMLKNKPNYDVIKNQYDTNICTTNIDTPNIDYKQVFKNQNKEFREKL